MSLQMSRVATNHTCEKHDSCVAKVSSTVGVHSKVSSALIFLIDKKKGIYTRLTCLIHDTHTCDKNRSNACRGSSTCATGLMHVCATRLIVQCTNTYTCAYMYMYTCICIYVYKHTHVHRDMCYIYIYVCEYI